MPPLACAPTPPRPRDYLWRSEDGVLPQDVPLEKLLPLLPETAPAGDDEQQATVPVGADNSCQHQ